MLPGFYFRPHKPRPHRARDFVTDHYSADRGRRHELNSRRRKLLRNRSSERFRFFGKLQHQRTLKVDRAVQTTRESKVTFQQRARLFELVDYFFRIQIITSINFASVLQSQA
jgi:hypothetical protein